MAGAQLRAEPNLPTPDQISEEGELSENDDFQSFQTPVDKPHAVNSSKTSKSKARRRSKYDILEESWNKKFGDLNEKVDLLLSSSMPAPQRRRHVESVYTDSSTNEEVSSKHDDVLSISASGKFSDSEDGVDENNNVSHENLSENTKKCLFDIFGEDAVVSKKPTQKIGIAIDQSQKEVLQNSYRTKEPNFLTAFSEDNYDLFPVNEETEKYLEVLSLDTLVDSCLVKRHGPKASFAKSKHKSLATQPYKMLEKIAFKGQQSARLGIVMQLYIQQALGNLAEHFQSENFSRDEGLDQIRNIFSMTTKCLDQIGRAGAFHHIIRRTVTMSDTSLYELDDALEFVNLPLSGEGVFGSGLEKLLQSRKEKKKQLEDLVPEVKRKPYKRRSDSPSRSVSDNKRSCFNKPSVPVNIYNSSTKPKDWGNFRVPRIPRDQRFQDKRQNYRHASRHTSSRSVSYPDRKYGHGKPVAK